MTQIPKVIYYCIHHYSFLQYMYFAGNKGNRNLPFWRTSDWKRQQQLLKSDSGIGLLPSHSWLWSSQMQLVGARDCIEEGDKDLFI